MWTPVEIEMVNLFSHPHSKYNFHPGACTVIFGRNMSDRSLENNGAGKTTLFEAVCIALTGDSLRKIDKEVFINNEASQCDISLTLTNAVMGMTLRIDRHFFRGNKASRVELFENGNQNTQMTSVAECNKRILELIGISREDLLRYYIISQDNHYTFFNASDSEKKEIMNRITSADMILPVIEEIDSRTADFQAKQAAIQREVDKLEERRATLQEQAEEMEANAAAGVDDAVAELEQKAKTYEEREAKGRDMLVTLERLREETLQKTKDLLLGAEENEVEEWGKKIRSKRKEINEVEEQLLECSRTKADINNFLSGEVTCPSCGEKFVPNSNIELTHDEAVEAKKQIEAQEKSLNELLEKKNHNLTIYKNKKEKAESAAEDYRKLQLDLRNFDRDIQEQKDAIDSYHKRAKRARTDAVALRDDTTWKKQLDDLRSKIAEAERQLKLKSKDLKPIEEEISMLRFWKYNMGRSGFQTYLANKSVSIIEGATNSYLERFGVDIRVRISGFKVLKSGDVREKIDVFVSNDGINWSSFMGKSGGERGRVTLAGVLGIQRLINMSTGGRGLDLMLFDECFHGMDGRGQENIIKVFEKMGSTIMVITQDVSEGFNNENTLIVVKEGGESRYL